MNIDFLLLAGGSPPTWYTDEMDNETADKVDNKVLIPILGKPCLKWVLDSFQQEMEESRKKHPSHTFQTLLVGTESIREQGLDKLCSSFIEVPPENGLPDNVRAGVAACQGDFIVLMGGDIPCIDKNILSRLVEQILTKKEYDIIVPLLRKESVESLFPGSIRTYAKLKEGQVKIANTFIVRQAAYGEIDDIMSGFILNRKSVFKLAFRFGIRNLLRLFVTKTMTVPALEAAFLKATGLRATGYFTEDAQLAVDLDKNSDIQDITTYLEKRGPL